MRNIYAFFNNQYLKVFFIFVGFLFVINSTFSQDWRQYPYYPAESLINFPGDEGYHPNEKVEWWYTNMHLRGKTTGDLYTVLLVYFAKDSLGYDGFRILNISNETSQGFFDDTRPCRYPTLDTSHLNIEADVFTHIESWATSKDSTGKLIPFEYDIQAEARRGKLDLHYTVNKRPLILADTGYFKIGRNDYTFYYSLTGIDVSGTLSFYSITEEVTGTAWIDKQYGTFNPSTGATYEWLSLQLSNGMDIMLLNIFTEDARIPDTSTYRLLGAYINEDSAMTYSTFTLDRLEYQALPRLNNIYTSKFRLRDTLLNLDLLIETTNKTSEVRRPFYFYEGPVLVTGSVDTQVVTGTGFAELLHQYQHPEITLVEPKDKWVINTPIIWRLENPDDGRPLQYDLSVRYEHDSSFNNIGTGLTDTSYTWDAQGYSTDSLLWLRITAYSVDTFLRDSIFSQIAFPLISNTTEYQSDESYRIYPIPATDIITLSTESNETNSEYDIYASDGQFIVRGRLQSKVNSLDISNFLPGRYYLVIRHGSSYEIKHFVKQ